MGIPQKNFFEHKNYCCVSRKKKSYTQGDNISMNVETLYKHQQ